MDLIGWLMLCGLNAPTAAVWGVCGALGALVLLAVAIVALCEGWELRSQRTARPRGATRQPPEQP
jgi:hypothetical protein